MKNVCFLFVLSFLSACSAQLGDKEKVHLAGTLLHELEQKAAYADSLKVEVLLLDPSAQNSLVQIPGGGFAFSKEYKEKVSGNKPLYRLVEKCNVSVLAYGTLKSYVAKELIGKVPDREKDSLMRIYNNLR
ncbi:MAG: hypothetical protein JNL13_05095, partial [Chitinophagaceae bacterium]|nr:hypothetical protein [Chitinophagaceae bacterium]